MFTIVNYHAAEVECDRVDLDNDYHPLKHYSFIHCYHPDHKNLITISITTIISTRTGEAGWPRDRRSRGSLHPLHF